MLGGGWLLLRTSPLVSVERVEVTGVHGANAAAIKSALSEAARHMSTLDVHVGSLRAAVAPFRVVRDLRVSAGFPHDLRIGVIEQLPVAALSVEGVRTAVAADGVVLGPALLTDSLPAVTDTAAEPLTGQRVKSPSLLAGLTVLGAAPASLARLATRVYMGPKGLTVTMRNGLRVYFGGADTPHAKWLSLARVLADPSSAGASYVDVRLPERPAAGFPNGSSPTVASGGGSSEGTPSTGEATGSQRERGAASESTAAALAAGLKAAAGGAQPTTTGKEAKGEAGSEESSTSASSESALGATPREGVGSSTTKTEAAPREGG